MSIESTDIWNDPFKLATRIRELGCAVALFTPEELTLADGTGLDAREVEEAMAEAGTERIEFLAESEPS